MSTFHFADYKAHRARVNEAWNSLNPADRQPYIEKAALSVKQRPETEQKEFFNKMNVILSCIVSI